MGGRVLRRIMGMYQDDAVASNTLVLAQELSQRLYDADCERGLNFIWFQLLCRVVKYFTLCIDSMGQVAGFERNIGIFMSSENVADYERCTGKTWFNFRSRGCEARRCEEASECSCQYTQDLWDARRH